MHNFCTYFDHRYVSRALALYDSLVRHCNDFTLWTLCLTPEAYRLVNELALPHVRTIALADLESHDPALLAAKSNRSTIEYYFTCSPVLPLYVFSCDTSVDVITYVDADLLFFADPAPLFAEFADNSVAVIRHRYAPQFSNQEQYGTYNVGYLSFRRDSAGLECLHWWRDRCNEWCYDRVDGDRFADQKYLNAWPNLFPRVVELHHKGANVGPWNVGNHPVTRRAGKLMIGDEPLIFYHFHGFKRVGPGLYDLNLQGYDVAPSRQIVREVYLPYASALMAARRKVAKIANRNFEEAGIRYLMNTHGHSLPEWIFDMTRRAGYFIHGLLTREFVPLILGLPFASSHDHH